MLLHIIRGTFLLALLAISLSYVTSAVSAEEEGELLAYHKPAVILGVVGFGVFVIGLDILISRKSLTSISGLFVGLLAGLLIAFIFSLLIDLVVDVVQADFRAPVFGSVYDKATGRTEWRVIDYRDKPVVTAIKLMVGIVCCYLTVSFVLQTKDDIRFVIPYVEFEKQTKGGRPLILDSSTMIDGRIVDVSDTGIFDNPMLVPRFVIQELQQVADSSDRLKRNRGRRGLDMVNKLQSSKKLDVMIYDSPELHGPVDQRLVALAEQLNGKVVTTDYNLGKVAQIRGVDVININDLVNSLKSIVLPGEPLQVKIVKAGEEPGQGVGYLEDGTMVVVEGARNKVGQMVTLAVTSSLQTSAGRMVFGRVEGARGNERGNHRST